MLSLSLSLCVSVAPQVNTLLRSVMDKKLGVEGAAEYAHMEEMRKWLLATGLRDGMGLQSVLEVLDAEGVDSVDLLGMCWAELKPMIKVGPAARMAAALAARK